MRDLTAEGVELNPGSSRRRGWRGKAVAGLLTRVGQWVVHLAAGAVELGVVAIWSAASALAAVLTVVALVVIATVGAISAILYDLWQVQEFANAMLEEELPGDPGEGVPWHQPALGEPVGRPT